MSQKELAQAAPTAATQAAVQELERDARGLQRQFAVLAEELAVFARAWNLDLTPWHNFDNTPTLPNTLQLASLHDTEGQVCCFGSSGCTETHTIGIAVEIDATESGEVALHALCEEHLVHFLRELLFSRSWEQNEPDDEEEEAVDDDE